MKFLVHSNAPFIKTGYGVQCAHLVDRLSRAGHDVAVSSTYGQQGSPGMWLAPSTGQPINIYPCGYEVNSNDIIHHHARHAFDGDEQGGWIIPILDVWALVNPLLADFNVAAWTMVDHFPVPPDVLAFFHRTNATPLACSRFGERLLFEAGLDPVYIPLSVDTSVYRPTRTVDTPAGPLTARQMLDIPDDAFVVGMVAMNKGWARDRKGFNEAFRAFGAFWQSHQNAVLYLHSEKFGAAEGINLVELATHAAIPEHAIRWVDQYAYRLGVPPEMMAATYTAMDVLLAPSHGEGFCVPLIEAQACGTPVIATDFSAQRELVGAGWLVAGQPEWDPAQHASYVCPSIDDVLAKLESAYRSDLVGMQQQAIDFAQQYDSDYVFDTYWLPFLKSLEPQPAPVVSYDRSPMPDVHAVAVIVPAMRPDNVERLAASFAATNDGSANLYVITDDDGGAVTTFAEKVNRGYRTTSEPWVLVVGDDCVFHAGWLEAARGVSGDFDVIGTNDAAGGRVRNPDVAAGRHSDHFFVRRAYVDTEGACLDGPGVLMPEAYKHWFTDKEVVELAKARGVFTPCLDSIVEHLHPGYDGREDLRQADPVYMKAVESAEVDAKTFKKRLPLIAMQRVGR